MIFTCTQENLTHGLSVVNRVASKNVALPILNNVLIIAENNQIQLQTTNLEVGITTTVRGKVETPGRYTVPSRLLTEFMSLLDHEKVTITTDDRGAHITSGHSKTSIKGLPAEDFPVLPTVTDAIKTSVPATELRACLEGVVFAAANDESRPEISGIYLQLNEQALVVAATDSYRLAERRCKTLENITQPKNVIIPARTIQEVLRVIQNESDNVVIQLGETQAAFEVGGVEIVSRLIDGRYPEYQQIIPQNWKTRVTLPRDEFVANIRAASLFCKPGINDLAIEISAEKKEVALRAANTQQGEHEATIPVSIEGEENASVFNYRYLLDGLQSFSGTEVSLELSNDQAPGVIRSKGGNEENLYLLMPIRQ